MRMYFLSSRAHIWSRDSIELYRYMEQSASLIRTYFIRTYHENNYLYIVIDCDFITHNHEEGARFLGNFAFLERPPPRNMQHF